jgi:hypothetical protein
MRAGCSIRALLGRGLFVMDLAFYRTVPQRKEF